MKTFNIHEAKTHFSKLVDHAARGDVIVIAKAGKPVAKLVAIDQVAGQETPRRTLGQFEGKYRIPDDFDAPLPDDVLEDFHQPLSAADAHGRDE